MIFSMLQDCERRAIAKLFRHKSEEKRSTPRQEAAEWNTFKLSFHRMTLSVHYFLLHPVHQVWEPDSGMRPSNAPIYYSKSDGCGPFCPGSAIKMWGKSKAEDKFYWRDLLGWGNIAAVSLWHELNTCGKEICDLPCLIVPIQFTIYCFISRPVMSQCLMHYCFH
jgi:hypothetical protein